MGNDILPDARKKGGADFNPRSPYGERPVATKTAARTENFNPRSPYGERPFPPGDMIGGGDFNPRSPYGERHATLANIDLAGDFNPRSPYGERHAGAASAAHDHDFHPRSPYGERQSASSCSRGLTKFQSTFPVWGTTERTRNAAPIKNISIHVPRMGNDRRCRQDK